MAVQLPGREARINEAFITEMDDLVTAVAEAMSPFLDKPYVVFGHSLGAIGGFEVIRELRRRGLQQPFLFISAGREAPQLREKKPPISGLSAEAFTEELRKDYGDNIGLILESEELREMFVPQIRADFALFESYRYRDDHPLDCSIVAYAGILEDDLKTEELNAWSAHTSRNFHSRRFPGDHFFIRESAELVIEDITREICLIRRSQEIFPNPWSSLDT
jgi:medium-chain acyl-[acyl-carrier-protein] hydrolase